MEIGFRTLLLRAKDNEPQAIAKLISVYNPLVTKLSIVNGLLDEDLHQELVATLVKCIVAIQYF